MNKPHLPLLFGIILLLVLVPMLSFGPGDRAIAQSGFPDPANEHSCPSQTGAGGGAEAIPAFVGPGSDGFSPNQSLCLPQLAPVPTGASPLAFIVKGVEPGDRVDSQGTVYVESIRGVPTATPCPTRLSNPFEACRAGSISGVGINRLTARRIRMERCRLNTKGSRTIAAYSG